MLESVKRIDFTDGTGIECIALFNENKINESVAKKAIELYPLEISQALVFMTKEQFESVFRD